MLTLLTLPEELLVGVLGGLELADLCRAAAACRTLRRVATDDRLLWRARCVDRYGPYCLTTRAEGSTWEQHWETLEVYFRSGCEQFNKNAPEGVTYMIKHKVLLEEPESIAEFLRVTPGLKKKSIGKLLGLRAKDCSKDDETNLQEVYPPKSVEDFYSRTAQLYMSSIDFQNKTVDEALRALLLKIKLPDSSQFIRRILKDFALVYFLQNREEAELIFKKPEGAYVSAYSILMLNTDLHNPRVTRRMKKEEFTEYFGSMLAGLPKEYIEGIYDRIKAAELQVAEDEDTTPGSTSTTTTRSEEGGKKAGFRGFFSRFF